MGEIRSTVRSSTPPANHTEYRTSTKSHVRSYSVRNVAGLAGVDEIRGMLGGLSRQRTAEIVSRKGFPDPLAVLGAGRIWDKDEVADWIAKHRPNQATSKPADKD